MKYDFSFTRKDRENLKTRCNLDKLTHKDGHWYYLDYSEDNHWHNADNLINMYLDERYYQAQEKLTA